jgi:hypothetical protein
MVPPDIPAGELEALLELWTALGGRRWRRGEQWRYSDACEWEGVTVRGGELLHFTPEVHLTKWAVVATGPVAAAAGAKGSASAVDSPVGSSSAATNSSTSVASSTSSKVRRQGRAQFKVGELVGVKCKLPADGGLAGWAEGDAVRPAKVELAALRGKGTQQFVEYSVR